MALGLSGRGHSVPNRERPRSEHSVICRSQEMTPDTKEILYNSVDGQKSLRLLCRLEPSHLSLALSCRLMRTFSTIVGITGSVVGD